MTARSRIAAVAVAAVVALAACGTPASERAIEAFPDLSDEGFTQFECGTGDAIGAQFQPPQDEQFGAQCWSGAPGKPYTDYANDVVDQVVVETEGLDVSASVCPEDLLSQTSAVACRAVQVEGEGEGEDVLLRIVVLLRNLDDVLAALPEEPTPEQITAVLEGADIELLVGTEPLPEGL
jgi:hypothetical protein